MHLPDMIIFSQVTEKGKFHFENHQSNLTPLKKITLIFNLENAKVKDLHDAECRAFDLMHRLQENLSLNSE